MNVSVSLLKKGLANLSILWRMFFLFFAKQRPHIGSMSLGYSYLHLIGWSSMIKKIAAKYTVPAMYPMEVWTQCGCFLKWWYPQNTPKWSFLVGKTIVVGYHHFRKPPCFSEPHTNRRDVQWIPVCLRQRIGVDFTSIRWRFLSVISSISCSENCGDVNMFLYIFDININIGDESTFLTIHVWLYNHIYIIWI